MTAGKRLAPPSSAICAICGKSPDAVWTCLPAGRNRAYSLLITARMKHGAELVPT